MLMYGGQNGPRKCHARPALDFSTGLKVASINMPEPQTPRQQLSFARESAQKRGTVDALTVNSYYCPQQAGVAKLVYALDSKSSEVHSSCRFESDLRQINPPRIQCS